MMGRERCGQQRGGIFIFVILLAVLAMSLYGCGKDMEAEERPESSVQEQEPEEAVSDGGEEPGVPKESPEAPVDVVDIGSEQLGGLIEALCNFYNPIRTMEEDPAGFCHGIMMWSCSEDTVQKLLEHYPDAYKEDYWLCIPEDSVKDFLRNSVGMDDISFLTEVSIEGAGYSTYSDGVFAVVHPDTGDYWWEQPVIAEVERVSDTEIRVTGTIVQGVTEDTSMTSFILHMRENADSIWGGYTLDAIEQWDTYLLPDADKRYYTEEEIKDWSDVQLRRARNEIYARHGRIFEDELLRDYFEGMDWYTGTLSASEFDESVFNEYEQANKDLLIGYEEKMGYR